MGDLFLGLQTAHGVFLPIRYEGKKQVGKASTMRENVSFEMWESHLQGNIGLGIIPINEQNECNWAVIDIDKYDLDIQELFDKIDSIGKPPFVMCRSKSSGVHLFIFFSVPASCKKVREYLRSQVSLLGLGNSEIFPKQDEVMTGRGDIGNWLNMPYFGDTRKCVINTRDGLKELDLEEFVEYAFSKRVLINDIIRSSSKLDYDKSVIKDGPPCLQSMSLTGFPPGTRNVAMFNLGVYAQKAFPTTWVKTVEKFNKELLSEPISTNELAVILKSLDKKEYFYQCNAEPLCSFCNAQVCRTRKYGISGSGAMPIVNSVTKVAGDFSIWFIDVEGGRLELTTEELYDNRKFRIKCVNALNILPGKMKDELWQEYLKSIIDKAIVINDEAMFKRTSIPDYFYQFILSRVSTNGGEISQGRVVYNKDRQEVTFKMESFINYLQYKKVIIEKGWLVMYFKSRGLKTGVGKDKERKSYRYSTLHVSEEEAIDIESKINMNEVI